MLILPTLSLWGGPVCLLQNPCFAEYGLYWNLFFVFSSVFYAGIVQSFFAFNAGAAFSAMFFAAFIARPCFVVVYSEFLSSSCNVAFCDVGVRCKNRHAVIRACFCGIAHGRYELRSAVGIDGMVAAVVGYHDVA